MVIKNSVSLCLRVSKFGIIILLLLACNKDSGPQMEFALGTVNSINLFESGNDQIYSQIFSRIREIDRTMSVFPGEFQELLSGMDLLSREFRSLTSGVVTINRQAGIAPVKVNADLLEVLETARYYAELSDGAFDPTIGPLVTLWGIGTTDTPRIPGDDEIAAALELVDWRDLVIDRAAGTAFLRREGMALDLGAIAKGYAGDEAARIAREDGVKRAIIDLGGNIVALGWRGRQGITERLPWRIGLQNPLDKRGAYIGILPAHDTSIVTSGVYERYFELNEKRYHHLFSTTTGYPADNGLLSVTIITASSTNADALSTAVFILGFERGAALVDSIPGVEAIFIFDDKTVRITDGLTGIFTLTDDAFTLLSY